MSVRGYVQAQNIVNAACMCLIGQICGLLCCHCCIIFPLFSDTLACCLRPFIPPIHPPSLLPSISASLPLSLAFTCSLVSGEITTAQKHRLTALHRSALFCIPPPIQHACKCTHTYILSTRPLTHKHASRCIAHKNTPTFTWVCLTPSPSISLLL